MKKFLFLTLILGAMISTKLHAQAGDPPAAAPDPAVMLQQMKDKMSPQMVE